MQCYTYMLQLVAEVQMVDFQLTTDIVCSVWMCKTTPSNAVLLSGRELYCMMEQATRFQLNCKTKQAF